MREYVPKYLDMREETARLTIQFIRNYDNFREQAEDLLALGVGIRTETAPPRGGSRSDPTARTASQREKLLDDIKAIEEGLEVVPEEYRRVVWEWIKEARPLYMIEGSAYASPRTWYEYKRRFITAVARRKGWI